MKNHVKSVFFEVLKFISNFNVFNNRKITLYYNVCMRTSGEKVSISYETDSVGFISSYKIIFRVVYIMLCL